jgi:hypothetical protein
MPSLQLGILFAPSANRPTSRCRQRRARWPFGWSFSCSCFGIVAPCLTSFVSRHVAYVPQTRESIRNRGFDADGLWRPSAVGGGFLLNRHRGHIRDPKRSKTGSEGLSPAHAEAVRKGPSPCRHRSITGAIPFTQGPSTLSSHASAAAEASPPVQTPPNRALPRTMGRRLAAPPPAEREPPHLIAADIGGGRQERISAAGCSRRKKLRTSLF